MRSIIRAAGNKGHQNNRRSGGFTLTELLVVIAVISILAAFLMPALAKSLETARASGCMSNQKQIVAGILMYADDHAQWTPPKDYGAWGEDDTWLHILLDGSYLSPYKKLGAAMKQFTGVVWQCPSGTGSRTSAWDSRVRYGDYLLNASRSFGSHTNSLGAQLDGGYWKWKSVRGIDELKLSLIRTPSQVFFLTDRSNKWIFTTSWALDEFIFMTHLGGGNAGFADGHAAFIASPLMVSIRNIHYLSGIAP